MTEQKAIDVLQLNRPFAYSELRNAVDIAIQALEEIQQYREIGTVEEFKALKEKAEPKKVLRPKDRLESYYHEESCPSCKKEFRVKICGYRFVNAVGKVDYCPYCGQHLDWE